MPRLFTRDGCFLVVSSHCSSGANLAVHKNTAHISQYRNCESSYANNGLTNREVGKYDIFINIYTYIAGKYKCRYNINLLIMFMT